MKKILAAILLLFMFIPVTRAAGQVPLSFSRDMNYTNIGDWVEQQSAPYYGTCDENPQNCVYNPYHTLLTGECVWNTDDRASWTTAGTSKLDPGASVSYSQCLIADTTMHLTGGMVYSKSPDLIISLHFNPANLTWSFGAPTLINHNYRYKGCVSGPSYTTNDPPAVTIPDSNGGWGVPTTITVTITNPTNRAVTIDPSTGYSVFDTSIDAEGLPWQAYCVQPKTPFHGADGSDWLVGV